MRRLIVALFILSLAVPAHAVERPVHTYSIVARDAATGELGVAVQSPGRRPASAPSPPRASSTPPTARAASSS